MTADGRIEGYRAAEAAANHAERVTPSWKTVAMVAFGEFLRSVGPGGTFVTPEAQAWCARWGLPGAPDARAFGSVVKNAARKGRIVDTGLRPRAGSHGREVAMWKVA